MPSLQDQLLKAGLVNKQKAKEAKTSKRKKAKAVRKGQAEKDDSLQQQIKAQQAEKQAKDQQLNQERQSQLDAKAELAKVKQMIQQLQLKEYQGEKEYNFSLDGTIKTLMLNEINHNALVKGRIAICRFEDQIALLPASAADKIAAVDAAYVVLQNDNQPTEVDEEDPYADFQIPDDLMW